MCCVGYLGQRYIACRDTPSTSPTKSPVRKIAFPERGEVGGRKPFQQEAQGIVSPRWQGTIPGFDDLWERAGPTGTDWGYVRRVIDDWKEKLRCPKCRKTAMANLCQDVEVFSCKDRRIVAVFCLKGDARLVNNRGKEFSPWRPIFCRRNFRCCTLAQRRGWRSSIVTSKEITGPWCR